MVINVINKTWNYFDFLFLLEHLLSIKNMILKELGIK